MTGPFLGYLDRSVSQNTISNRSSRDVPRSVRSPFHFPFHLHLVPPFVFRGYPRVRRGAHLLAADKLVSRQVRRLKVTVGSRLFRGAGWNGGDRGHATTALPRTTDRRVSSIKRLFEQLLLQKHRLLKIGDIGVHGVGGQITRARRIRSPILVILRARYSLVRIISVNLFVGECGTRAPESLLLLLLLLLLVLLLMMVNRGHSGRAKNQRALVMIFLPALQLQRERITVARFAGVVSARAVLLLARAIALRRAIPSTTARRLIPLTALRVLDHGARPNGRGDGCGLTRG